MSGQLQGDDLVTALIPLAERLISAVHAVDPEAVAAVLDDATELAGDFLAANQHLVVLLAGMCSEDHAANAALGWTVNPAEYHRLRSSHDALTASLRAGRTTTEKRGA